MKENVPLMCMTFFGYGRYNERNRNYLEYISHRQPHQMYNYRIFCKILPFYDYTFDDDENPFFERYYEELTVSGKFAPGYDPMSNADNDMYAPVPLWDACKYRRSYQSTTRNYLATARERYGVITKYPDTCYNYNEYIRDKDNKRYKTNRMGGLNMTRKRYSRIMEDIDNPLSGVKSVITRRINGMVDTAIKYSGDAIKRNFGKEYMFNWGDNSSIITEVTDKFIKKYDKKFDKHVTKGVRDIPHIQDKEYIIRLDQVTYMYIATGQKIGNTENRWLMSNSVSSNDMYIYIFGKKMLRYSRELDKLTHDVFCTDELGLFVVDSQSGYRGRDDGHISETMDVTYSKLALRNLDTLFFSSGEKTKICNHIDKFNANKDFYFEKQLLYKTGILLYGEPGTGKSSLVKAIATTYNRSIISVNTSNIAYIDLAKLTQSINVDEQRSYIVLFEDIDTLFLNREDDKSTRDDQSIINKLLQFLDSNTSPTNVIFIATTNHKERLDEALLREGRFDLKVEIEPLKDKECLEFGTSFTLTEQQTKEIIEKIHKETPERERINQSLLQARILAKVENRSDEKAKEIYGVMVDDSEKVVKEEKKVEEDVEDY